MDYAVKKYQYFSEAFYSGADKRMDDFPLMYSWWYTVVIVLSYLMVIKYGKAFMKNKNAYDARLVMAVYNFIMVIISVALVAMISYHYIVDEGNLHCWKVDFSNKGYPFTGALSGWLFYFTKIIELTDTMFFIVRKKFHLLTFLHIFHHAMMPLSVWFGIKFASGGSNSLYPLINSFVHILMYAYYGMAAMGPKYTKYLWWKQYMTQIQMIQFLMLIIHSSIVLLDQSCEFPKVFMIAIFTYSTIFFFLFLNYYLQTYKKKE